MKEVKMYQCEICKEVYYERKDAIECESEGKESPLAEIGQECWYEVKMGGGWSPFHIPVRILEIEDEGHYIKYNLEEYDEHEQEWYEGKTVFGNYGFQEKLEIKSNLKWRMKMNCSCGGVYLEVKQDTSWIDKSSKAFTIFNVPILICDNCEDRLIFANIQYSVSHIADQMRSGKLPTKVQFKHII